MQYAFKEIAVRQADGKGTVVLSCIADRIDFPAPLVFWRQRHQKLQREADVSEAVAGMQDPPFTIEAPLIPNGRPAIFWVDLEKVILEAGADVMKLDTLGPKVLAGEVSSEFTAAERFKFLTM